MPHPYLVVARLRCWCYDLLRAVVSGRWWLWSSSCGLVVMWTTVHSAVASTHRASIKMHRKCGRLEQTYV